MTKEIELISNQEEIPIDPEEIQLCKNCNYCRVVEDKSKKPLGVLPVPGFYNISVYPNIALCLNTTFIMNNGSPEVIRDLVSLDKSPLVQNIRTKAICEGFKGIAPVAQTEYERSSSEYYKDYPGICWPCTIFSLFLGIGTFIILWCTGLIK